MRAVLPLLVALATGGNLPAQTNVPPDQCLGGRLLAIQQDSITLQFNARITSMPIAPGAEIWRHGVDVRSIRQLVPGDDVYLKCERSRPNGPVMAAIVAVPEGGDSLNLEPHHITAINVCAGKLVAVTSGSVSVKDDQGICKVQTNAQTMFWRGKNFRDATALRIGDDVDIRYAVGYPGRVLTAESVEANVDKCEGTIVGTRPGMIIVENYRPRDRIRVYYDADTRTMDPDSDNEHEFTKLKKKTLVLAVGLHTGRNSMRATTIYIER